MPVNIITITRPHLSKSDGDLTHDIAHSVQQELAHNLQQHQEYHEQDSTITLILTLKPHTTVPYITIKKGEEHLIYFHFHNDRLTITPSSHIFTAYEIPSYAYSYYYYDIYYHDPQMFTGLIEQAQNFMGYTKK